MVLVTVARGIEVVVLQDTEVRIMLVTAVGVGARVLCLDLLFVLRVGEVEELRFLLAVLLVTVVPVTEVAVTVEVFVPLLADLLGAGAVVVVAT